MLFLVLVGLMFGVWTLAVICLARLFGTPTTVIAFVKALFDWLKPCG